MSSGLAHIKNWLSKASPDYYTMFVKAWIPLNAWYVNEFDTQQDRIAIDKLRTTRNKIRNRIETLLSLEETEGKNFRYHLACLHMQFEERRLEHRGIQVTFTKVKRESDEHREPATDTDKKGNVYMVSANPDYYHVQIIRERGKGKNTMDIKFSSYNLRDLTEHKQYVGLADSKMQEKIRLCFQKMDPENTVSLLPQNYYASGDKIVMDSQMKISFIDNKELIAKTLIEHIYTLRCMLFHGEVDPTDTNQAVYEHAYYILRSIIKELH